MLFFSQILLGSCNTANYIDLQLIMLSYSLSAGGLVSVINISLFAGCTTAPAIDL